MSIQKPLCADKLYSYISRSREISVNHWRFKSFANKKSSALAELILANQRFRKKLSFRWSVEWISAEKYTDEYVQNAKASLERIEKSVKYRFQW